ncbi:MAG: CRISPR-associated endonuclease Cas1 [Candidatus Nanoarchaeia archaeon]|nr:CRISPR-associated endonuclease Cas1 [Candidatus Nanoarchaeia archaeon]
MDLIFTTPGTYLSVKDEMILVTVGENKTKVSPVKVDRLILTSDGVITTAVINLCTENNIDIIILDKYGNPSGRFWHCRFGSLTTIRRKQLEYSDIEKGFEIAKGWIVQKITNQIEFCEEISKNRTLLHDDITPKLDSIRNNLENLKNLECNSETKIGNIIGLEGNSSRMYFEILNLCLSERFKFNGRSRQPAEDPFNAFLNYAYGVLYSEVERGCIIAGLDPYIGFLHTDNYNKKSLVFDIIENFRIDADTIVFHLFTKKLVNSSMYDELKAGYSLNKEGKKLFFDERSKYYEKIVRYGNKNIARSGIIQAFCHKFANDLLN